MKLQTLFTLLEADFSIHGKESYKAYIQTLKSCTRALMTALFDDIEKLKVADSSYPPTMIKARSHTIWWRDNQSSITGSIKAILAHRRIPAFNSTKELLDIGRTIFTSDSAKREGVASNGARSIAAVDLMKDVLTELMLHETAAQLQAVLDQYEVEYKGAYARYRAQSKGETSPTGSSKQMTKQQRLAQLFGPDSRKKDTLEPDEQISDRARVINHDQMVSQSTRVHQQSYATGLVDQTIAKLPTRLQDAAKRHVAKSNNKLSALRDFLTRQGFDIDNM